MKFSDFKYLSILHRYAKSQVDIITRTQNTGNTCRNNSKSLVLTNVKCYNFGIKHCFYLKFGRATLFVKWNQTKVIFSRFSPDFPLFFIFLVPDVKNLGNRMNCEKSGLYIKVTFLWNILTETKRKIPIIGIL